MSFAGDLRAFSTRLDGRAAAVFEGVVAEAKASIITGSALTGSPGQPVGATGDMRASWTEQRPGPYVAEITTKDPGSFAIEHGRRLGRRLHRRATIGGFHSLKLTMAHFGRILTAVVAEVRAHG